MNGVIARAAVHVLCDRAAEEFQTQVESGLDLEWKAVKPSYLKASSALSHDILCFGCCPVGI